MPTCRLALVRRLLGPAVLALLLSAPALRAQNAISPAREAGPNIRRVISSLEQVRGIIQAALSPDGRQIAWVVAEDGGAGIEVASTANPSRSHAVTASPGAACLEENLAWSPDSTRLAFTSDCEGQSQQDIYLATIAGHSASSDPTPLRLTHLHGSVDSLAFSPDGKRIGFLYVEGATRHPGALDAMPPPSGVIGAGSTEIQRVSAVSIESGATERLTPSNLHVYEYDWSPDSKRLVYIAAPPPGENNWWVAKLYVQYLSLMPGAAVSLCRDEKPCAGPYAIFDPNARPGPLHGLQIAVPRWSPDGRTIAFIGGLMSDQGVTGGDVYQIASSGGGVPANLTPDSSSTAVWFSWTDRTHLIVSSIDGGSSRVDELQLANPGEPGANTTSRHLLMAAASLDDGRPEGGLSLSASGKQAAFIESSFARPPEIYAGPLTAGGPQQITHLNGGLKPAWGKAESIDWRNESFRIQGWLLYPEHYDPARKYPLIVSVHGGPSSAVVPHWPFPGYNPIAFSALGYFVLMPNPRGSYGRGEAFTQANRKDFGYGDLRDILAGLDLVEAKFPVNPKRIGITGWSYGGFMTMFAVTQTQRFQAAVAGAGISDWQSYYGENSIDQWMIPFFGASVYDDPAVYAKSSAINFIRSVKTPTLVVVGDRDGECPAPQSFEFWHALRAERVPTQLVVYPGEGHRFNSPEHRRDVLERALSWFEQSMPPQSEQAPKPANKPSL